jgi:hypothetical protein
MLRTTRLLASALFVISMSVFGARVGFGQDLEPDPPPDCPNPPCPDAIYVIGVEKRSNCELVEWWVQAANASTEESYRLTIHTRVKASVGPEPLCIEDETRVIELVPGQCRSLGGPFANPPGQPCDDPCCLNTQPGTPERDLCLNCTNIIEATVQVTHWKAGFPGAVWKSVAGQPTVATITNGVPSSIYPNRCRVINTCSPSDPHYRDWGLAACQPGL